MKVEDKKVEVRDKVGEKLIIGSDSNIEDILKAHKQGYSIHFDGQDFIDLNEEDLGKLPKQLLIYYNVALKESVGKLHEVHETISKAGTMAREFGYDRRVADPKDQLIVEDVPEGFRFKWVRAYDNEITTHERGGYIKARGDMVKTFANDGSKSGGHYVGSEDKPELVGMLISEENYKLNEERIKRPSLRMKEATKQKYKDSIERTGLPGARAEIEGD